MADLKTHNNMKESHVLEKLITPDELCRLFRIPKSQVYKLVHQKKIPYLKIGRALRFEESQIILWLEKQRNATVEKEEAYSRGEKRQPLANRRLDQGRFRKTMSIAPFDWSRDYETRSPGNRKEASQSK